MVAVCSAVGVLPLSLQYGFSVVEKYVTHSSCINVIFSSALLNDFVFAYNVLSSFVKVLKRSFNY